MAAGAVNQSYGRLVEAEVADQLEQLGVNRSANRLGEAADGILAAAGRHELEPDDPVFWRAVAEALRGIISRAKAGQALGADLRASGRANARSV